MLTGQHLIAGDWVDGPGRFQNAPVNGAVQEFHTGSRDLVDRACQAAEAVFDSYAATSRAARADFLDAIADEIERRGADLTAIGAAETGLPEARLEGERGRTTGQLRLFASHIRQEAYLDLRHDPALPDRAPLPRPDLRMIQLPVGPVAVFGASNFPLAFSVAGGDTASALAAGCPVVVKGHEAHPGTSEIVAQAILAAITAQGMPAGVFSLVHGGSFEVGQALVQHPLITAAGFTGSLRGGRALFDLCAARPDPIPFFGELGSVNPMFLLPGAAGARGAEIGAGWAGSLSMGAGQFCTNPGIAIVQQDQAGPFVEAAAEGLRATAPQTMLTGGIAEAYRAGKTRMAETRDVQELVSAGCDQRSAEPALYLTDAENWLANADLAEEIFGPVGLVVTVRDMDQMAAIARSLSGQLTCTLHLDDDDHEAAAGLMPVLTRKAGRILTNGFPTGVEVCDAMVHGGPYPASTNFGATSVGTMAIRRFLRPVCFQSIPGDLLPADLRD
ncbi:aldehyde dehydrogenase (NADP(+)) [Rhodophyticola sp. CCM32]|uniref:aldehyde dehydrogenase (NADP(+)) n=1 Tax=Rhodophyticola sp. CCM32 TaxID=2916397 RepID=UPI00107F5D5C|nr:aldehyde dehydrogenase (NADP(+)) [Rhodophyticola sp. CCM32]QBY00069.1 aldehyde dehydrogenase (NADP(+)) [Rhodophyticola sp. CCM32]